MSGSSNTPGRTGGFGNSSGGLNPHDRKLLSTALEAGRSLERALASQGLSSKRLSSKRLASEDSLSANLNFDIAELEAEFRKHLVALDTGDSALVKKQAEYAPKVDASLGEKHLAVLLVPLERLLGRAARDEEFLYLEGDRTELSPDALAIKNSQPRIVICENLRSAFNVGAIFRTGECFLANQIWLTGYTAPPVKTAMGTENLVPWKSVAHTKDAITEAKSLGYQVVALEVTPDATPLDQFQWPEKAALVLGNERFGLDSETLSACDHVVKVPTSGLKNSLNVGIAFGIASATWRRSATPTQLASQAFAAAALASAASASAASASVKTISPIGYIKGGYVSPQSTPRQGSYARTPSTPGESARADTEAEVVLEAKFDGQPANFEQALKELEGFSHIWLLFGFHHSQSWLPQVRPPRGDGSLKGVFATRAPHRPNGLGLSCVRLLGIKGRTLRISHHDLLQGTPIYDIKPYVPEADAFPDAEAGWISALPAPHPLVESEVAREKLDWLSQEGESRLRDFLFEQLRYQPFDLSRKRIEILPPPANAPTTPSANTAKDMPSDAPNRPSDKSPAMHPGGATLSPIHFIAAFRTWRFHAALTPTADSSGTITITDVTSGYSDQDLRDPSDPYGDKDLHRRFHARH